MNQKYGKLLPNFIELIQYCQENIVSKEKQNKNTNKKDRKINIKTKLKLKLKVRIKNLIEAIKYFKFVEQKLFDLLVKLSINLPVNSIKLLITKMESKYKTLKITKETIEKRINIMMNGILVINSEKNKNKLKNKDEAREDNKEEIQIGQLEKEIDNLTVATSNLINIFGLNAEEHKKNEISKLQNDINKNSSQTRQNIENDISNNIIKIKRKTTNINKNIKNIKNEKKKENDEKNNTVNKEKVVEINNYGGFEDDSFETDKENVVKIQSNENQNDTDKYIKKQRTLTHNLDSTLRELEETTIIEKYLQQNRAESNYYLS